MLTDAFCFVIVKRLLARLKFATLVWNISLSLPLFPVASALERGHP
jgi:hypothetical protein